jgi:ATP-binding cassette, subfamily B, multidrug efflux pump
MSGMMRGPRGGRGGRGGPLTRPAPGTVHRLLRLILSAGGWRGPVVLAAILVSAAAGVAGAVFTQVLIDDFITPLLDRADPSFAPLARALTGMAVLYAVGVGATLLYNWLVVAIAQRLLRDVRDRMFSHLQRLPLRFFDTTSHGDVMSRFTNDTDTLRQMVAQAAPQLISSAATVVTVFVTMVVLSWRLSLFVLVGAAVLVIATRLLLRRSGEGFRRQQASIGALNGFAEETVNGQRVVKVFNHEQASQRRFDELDERWYRDSDRANAFANVLMPTAGGIGNLLYVVVAVGGGMLALGGAQGLTVGVIAAFLQLTRSFTMPLAQISQQFNAVVMALAGAERIFALLDEPVEPDDGDVRLVEVTDAAGPDGADAGGVDVGGTDTDGTDTRRVARRWTWQLADGSRIPLTGDVRLDHVTFGYTPGHPVLHDISLHAEPGQTIAFVGSTGAGKTTITNLLTRFYDPDAGTIRLDGIDLAWMRRDDLRRCFGMVLQDTALFTGTVAENIRFGRPDATDAEVRAAARAGLGRRVHPHPAARLGHRDLGQHRQPLAGAAAAARDRPRGHRRPAGDDPRRGDLERRHPHRAARAAGHGRPDARAHRVRDRPPTVDRARCRRDHGARARAYHRGRQPRRADGRPRRLLPAAHRAEELR